MFHYVPYFDTAGLLMCQSYGVHCAVQLARIVLSELGLGLALGTLGLWIPAFGQHGVYVLHLCHYQSGKSFMGFSHDGLEPAPGHALNARSLLPCLYDLCKIPPTLVYAALQSSLLMPSMRFFSLFPRIKRGPHDLSNMG